MKKPSVVCQEQEKIDQIREDIIRNVSAVWDDQCNILIHTICNIELVFLQYKHLKGQLGPHVGNMTFLDHKEVSWGSVQIENAYRGSKRDVENTP